MVQGTNLRTTQRYLTDGKYAIYFAMDGKWKSASRGSWTAISRTPFLKALAFFTKETAGMVEGCGLERTPTGSTMVTVTRLPITQPLFAAIRRTNRLIALAANA